MHPRITPLLFGVSLLATTPALAGPWTKDSGQMYAKVSTGAFIAGQYVDPAGRETDDVDYLGWTQALYAEVGVGPAIQIQMYLPHVTAQNTYAASGDRYLSFGGGDARLGAQWSPPVSIPVSVRLDAKIPMYDITEPGGLEGPLFPARGDGQVDVDGWVSVGGSLGSLPLYGFIDVGYRHRTAAYPGGDAGIGYADSMLTYAQLGYTVGAGIIIAANAQAVAPLEDDGRTKGYGTMGPSIYAPVGGGLALEGYYDATIWASAASRGQTIILGVSYAGEVW